MPNHSSNILPTLILASASPRRSELLKRIGIPFETLSAELVEDDLINGLKQENPKDYIRLCESAALSLVRGKSKIIKESGPDCLVTSRYSGINRTWRSESRPAPKEAAGMLRLMRRHIG